MTDAQGLYTGQIAVGGDKSDRQVVASVTVNGITKQTSLRVTGSKLVLQAVPPTPAPGQTVAVTLTLQDAAANPIPGATLTMGGTIAALQNRTVTTDLSGSASVSFTAPATAGSYTISATGSGVSSADYQLQVFTSAIPVAVIPVGAGAIVVGFTERFVCECAGCHHQQVDIAFPVSRLVQPSHSERARAL